MLSNKPNGKATTRTRIELREDWAEICGCSDSSEPETDSGRRLRQGRAAGKNRLGNDKSRAARKLRPAISTTDATMCQSVLII